MRHKAAARAAWAAAWVACTKANLEDARRRTTKARLGQLTGPLLFLFCSRMQRDPQETYDIEVGGVLST